MINYECLFFSFAFSKTFYGVVVMDWKGHVFHNQLKVLGQLSFQPPTIPNGCSTTEGNPTNLVYQFGARMDNIYLH